MRKMIALLSAFALVAPTVAYAGGMTEPAVEEVVIVPETAPSSISPGWIVAGIGAAVLLAVALDGDDDDSVAATTTE